MAYTYYRERPAWGTQQYQFAPPPEPAFRPQSTWGGRDFYNAAAVIQDPSIYEQTYDRVIAADASSLGVGFNEARHWHRRVYGGLAETSSILPAELGAAAGYEAYRNWMHNSSVYEPLMPDDLRQREAIIGLAVAEATRLWQGTGRRMDRFGLQQACDAAGATASVIIGQWSENEPYRSPPMRGGSIGGSVVGGAPPVIASPMMGSPDPYDAYAYDDDLYRRRRRRNRRHSTVVQSQPPPTIINVGGGAGPQPFPVQYSGMQPGMQPRIQLSSSPYQGGGGLAGYPGSYGAGSDIGAGGYGAASAVGGYSGSSVGVGGYPGGYNPGIAATGYGAPMGQPMMMGGAPLGGGILNPMPPSMQPAYQASMAAQYPNAMPNIGGIVPGQGLGGPIIIPPPSRHHRHHSRERERERSSERRERRRRRNSDAAAYSQSYAPSMTPSMYSGRY